MAQQTPVEALRAQAERLRADGLTVERRDEMVDAVEHLAARHRWEFTAVLNGGTESVVATYAGAGGRRIVVKASAAPGSAAHEAAVLDATHHTPDVVDVDPDRDVLAMSYIDGVALSDLPVGDPQREWHLLQDLVDDVTSSGLDPATFVDLPTQIAGRAGRFAHSCERLELPDVAERGAAAVAAVAAWSPAPVPLDLFPRNIIVGGDDSWTLIDPMATRATPLWCSAKWVMARKSPGEPGGARRDTWLPKLHEKLEGRDVGDLLTAVLVWEIGSRQDDDSVDGRLRYWRPTIEALA